jgi:prolyl-tRNA synthetase
MTQRGQGRQGAGAEGGFRFATVAEIEDALRLQAGLPGPDRHCASRCKVVADRTVAVMSDFVCGANEADFHSPASTGAATCPSPTVADIRNVVEGDPSPDGKGVLAIQRGIEVGHVFYLGTKYSQAMNATYLDETGKPQLMEMGCYGIGVTRMPARPSNRTTTSAASSGRTRSRRSRW